MTADAIAAARRMKRGEDLGLGVCPHVVILGVLEEIERLQAQHAPVVVAGVRCDVCGAGPTENCDLNLHPEAGAFADVVGKFECCKGPAAGYRFVPGALVRKVAER